LLLYSPIFLFWTKNAHAVAYACDPAITASAMLNCLSGDAGVLVGETDLQVLKSQPLLSSQEYYYTLSNIPQRRKLVQALISPRLYSLGKGVVVCAEIIGELL